MEYNLAQCEEDVVKPIPIAVNWWLAFRKWGDNKIVVGKAKETIVLLGGTVLKFVLTTIYQVHLWELTRYQALYDFYRKGVSSFRVAIFCVRFCTQRIPKELAGTV